jgi:hypothetical protein
MHGTMSLKQGKPFEHLFIGRRFAPEGGACADVPGRCELLLEKLSSSDFTFVAPLEHSARPDMPALHKIQMRCRKLRSLADEFDHVQANPTKGFAVYLMPSSVKGQKIYIVRAEDYVSEIDKADILSDGLLIIVAYPACHVLKELPITKSHISPYEPATPNPELRWLSEPIVLDGKAFILSLFANNGVSPNPPHHLLQLMSVAGFAGTGGEAYTFVAK